MISHLRTLLFYRGNYELVQPKKVEDFLQRDIKSDIHFVSTTWTLVLYVHLKDRSTNIPISDCDDKKMKRSTINEANLANNQLVSKMRLLFHARSYLQNGV